MQKYQFLLVMFMGLPMCFNIGSVDAIHEVQGKDYIPDDDYAAAKRDEFILSTTF